jgi:hypothetical protein
MAEAHEPKLISELWKNEWIFLMRYYNLNWIYSKWAVDGPYDSDTVLDDSSDGLSVHVE